MPPNFPRKRSTNARPRQSRSKKARVEEWSGTGVGGGVGNERPSIQRQGSARRGARTTNLGITGASGPNTIDGQTSLSSQANTGGTIPFDPSSGSAPLPRDRVVCLVPGTDTLKIGWAEASKPFLVRQLVAYRYNIRPPVDDVEMKDATPPNSNASLSPSRALSELDSLQLSIDRDEGALSEHDAALLTKWRRKRELEIAGLEKILSGSGKKRSIAPKLVPTQGSIHDANVSHIELVPSATNSPPPSLSSTTPRAIYADTILAPKYPPSTSTSVYGPKEPFCRGVWRITPTSSLRSCADEIEDIIRHACETHLNLKSTHQLNGRAVSAVIPEPWHQREITEFIEILLGRIGFRELFLVKESVASTFGAGLSTACVVDIGASKTTVACIEDGLLVPSSLFILNWGSRDIEDAIKLSITDKTFWQLNDKRLVESESLSPYHENMCVTRMREQIRGWKETYAHCIKNPELATQSPAATNPILTYLPHQPATMPTSIPNELLYPSILACVALFHPSIFPTSSLHIEFDRYRQRLLDREYRRQDPTLIPLNRSSYNPSLDSMGMPTVPSYDPAIFNDEPTLVGGNRIAAKKKAEPPQRESPKKETQPAPFKLDRRRKDHQLLLQTYTEEQLIAGAHLIAEEAAKASAAASSSMSTPSSSIMIDSHESVSPDTLLPSSAASAAAPPLSPVETFLAHRMPLHEAICASLQAVATPESQAKLSQAILLTGGGSNIPQLAEALEER